MREYFSNIIGNWNDEIDNTMDVNSTWRVIHEELLYSLKLSFKPRNLVKNNQ